MENTVLLEYQLWEATETEGASQLRNTRREGPMSIAYATRRMNELLRIHGDKITYELYTYDGERWISMGMFMHGDFCVE